MSRKVVKVDDNFVKTIRIMYPFSRSLYHATKKLNEDLKWILGNDKLFNTKKR